MAHSSPDEISKEFEFEKIFNVLLLQKKIAYTSLNGSENYWVAGKGD